MKRVLIIGPPGAGKSTLARKLSAALGVPLIHLDSLFWSAGWKMCPREEFLELQSEALAGEFWVIDGNFGSTLDLRIQRADTVLYLDFPIGLCLWRVLKRVITSHGKTRPDMAEGCPERFDWGFLLYIVRFRRDERPQVESVLKEQHDCEVHRLSRPWQVDAFLTELQLPA